VRIKVAGGDVGFLLQTNFVTKVLLGLFGSDNLRIAVSPDGSAFNDAIEIDEATGIVDLPSNPKFSGFTGLDANNNMAGKGASSKFGAGGQAFVGNAAGQQGLGYGAGGGGGAVASNATGRAGGAGSAGYLEIWEFT
jgi:hypothetical protein